jgi:hypothetical protein
MATRQTKKEKVEKPKPKERWLDQVKNPIALGVCGILCLIFVMLAIRFGGEEQTADQVAKDELAKSQTQVSSIFNNLFVVSNNESVAPTSGASNLIDPVFIKKIWPLLLIAPVFILVRKRRRVFWIIVLISIYFFKDAILGVFGI